PVRMTAYAELQVTSNFSFLRGASHPEELVQAAAGQGLSAIALPDRNSLAGVVRAHKAARQAGIRFVLGVRLDLREALPSPPPLEGGGRGGGAAARASRRRVRATPFERRGRRRAACCVRRPPSSPRRRRS